MTRPKITALCLAGLATSFAPSAIAAGKTPRHLKAGECTATRIEAIDGRLENMPESGSYVGFTDGRQQVSYDVIPAIKNSRVGDPVRICLRSYPRNCPKGDMRGIIYTAHNLRSGLSWTLPDAEHMCGGA
jgi:hypothetical protein